jgi:5-formyltetrahydrofolate cyclo-ligase
MTPTDHGSRITDHESSSLPNYSNLRASMRLRRRSLTSSQRRIASLSVARRLIRLRLLRTGLRIAVYNAIDGEIDLSPLIHHAQRAGCAVYAPHVVDRRARKMEFRLLSRRVGLLSSAGRSIHPRELDVVLTPLVAFDRRGHRLGFGAGFYDRKLSFMRHRGKRKPMLIGVGYEFQCVPDLKPQPWDVPLHFVATECRLYRC